MIANQTVLTIWQGKLYQIKKRKFETEEIITTIMLYGQLIMNN